MTLCFLFHFSSCGYLDCISIAPYFRRIVLPSCAHRSYLFSILITARRRIRLHAIDLARPANPYRPARRFRRYRVFSRNQHMPCA